MEGHGRARDHAPASLTVLRRRAILALALGAVSASVWSGRGQARALVRSWTARVAVEGGSMAPTLLPGDWLLVDPDAYMRRRPRPGELVLVGDPRLPTRLLVKRVSSVQPDGVLEVVGDAPTTSTDSRTFGPVEPGVVAGRPWFRYWPPERFGPIH